jgi:hypothetical protein
MDAPLDLLPNRSIDESREPIEDLQENVEELTVQPHQLRTCSEPCLNTGLWKALECTHALQGLHKSC